MLVTSMLSVYYLPRLSELKTGAEIRREILLGYRVILPVAVVCACLVYLMRDFIIVTLFSAAFRPMEALFLWQLIGDVLKIASWLIAFVMLAKAMMGLFIVTELIFAAGFYGLVYKLTAVYGLEAVAISHSILYSIYLFCMYWVLNRKGFL